MKIRYINATNNPICPVNNMGNGPITTIKSPPFPGTAPKYGVDSSMKPMNISIKPRNMNILGRIMSLKMSPSTSIRGLISILQDLHRPVE